MHDIEAIIQTLDRRFASGNSVDVERSTIKREEWDAIKRELSKLRSAGDAVKVNQRFTVALHVSVSRKQREKRTRTPATSNQVLTSARNQVGTPTRWG